MWLNKEQGAEAKVNSHVKRVLRAVSDFLNQYKWVNVTLPYSILDAQPFLWDGFKVAPRYTYLLDMSRGEEELQENYGKGLRQALKKIQTTEYNYSYSLDQTSKELIKKSSTAGRSQNDMKYLDNLLNSIKSIHQVKVIKAGYENSVSVAVFLVIGAKAIYLLGGSESDQGSVVGSAVLLKGIEQLKSTGVELLDFEGSMIPGVEKFFRSFGGNLNPLFNIAKTPKLIQLKDLILG